MVRAIAEKWLQWRLCLPRKGIPIAAQRHVIISGCIVYLFAGLPFLGNTGIGNGRNGILNVHGGSNGGAHGYAVLGGDHARNAHGEHVLERNGNIEGRCRCAIDNRYAQAAMYLLDCRGNVLFSESLEVKYQVRQVDAG